MSVRVLLRRLEYTLWVAGALASGFFTGALIGAHVYQALQNQRLELALRSRRPAAPAIPPANRSRAAAGSLVGRLEIPRLGFSTIVLEGSDSRTLRGGVGRIPETAEPGESGNVVLGGHRDTVFRPLRGIRVGDSIVMVTPSGRYRYIVDWTKVVSPADTSSLRPTPGPALTLVTCYPFRYVGPAPQRFIVRARQINKEATRWSERS